jgi:hypothetical protein
MTDEGFRRLIGDFKCGLITMDQIQAAGLDREVKDYLDSSRYAYIETMRKDGLERKNFDTINPLHYEMHKDSSDPCEGCSNLVSLYVDGVVFEQCCEDRTCPIWLKDHPKDKIKRVKTLTVKEWRRKVAKEEEPANPCAGCKFRKYHDWLEPTWKGFSVHYYDCENPYCPNWSRLWWRKNDDGTALLDQAPIKLKRKVQHVAYEFVEKLNDVIYMILEKED